MAGAPRKGRRKGVDEFLEIPYLDRKFVFVVDDEVARAARSLGTDIALVDDARWRKTLAEVNGLASPSDVERAWLEVRDISKRARDGKTVALSLLAQEDALLLDFPLGHPVHKVLYVGHPADPRRYLPIGDFHRSLFEHKVAEAMRLLVGLGATDLEVSHVFGWTSTSEVGVSAGGVIEGIRVDANGKVGKTKGHSQQVMAKMTLSPRGEPRLPSDLIWYVHEPLWKAIAEARLSASLESFELDIIYKDDFQVSAKLGAKIASIGLELGGSFTEHKETVWHLQGKFGALTTS